MDLLAGAAQAVVAVALVLAAAKAHGRQLRLERTQAGYPDADFRGANAAWVEALWRQDRVRFWSLFAALAPLTVVAAYVVQWSPVPFWVRAALVLAWAMAACFTAMGVWSLWRLAERDSAGWRSHAIGSSFLWWTLVALLSGLSAGLAA
ncbi:MAG: hypothetical protein ABR586_06380 [Thermoplasmatota archaeon]